MRFYSWRSKQGLCSRLDFCCQGSFHSISFGVLLDGAFFENPGQTWGDSLGYQDLLLVPFVKYIYNAEKGLFVQECYRKGGYYQLYMVACS